MDFHTNRLLTSRADSTHQHIPKIEKYIIINLKYHATVQKFNR